MKADFQATSEISTLYLTNVILRVIQINASSLFFQQPLAICDNEVELTAAKVHSFQWVLASGGSMLNLDCERNTSWWQMSGKFDFFIWLSYQALWNCTYFIGSQIGILFMQLLEQHYFTIQVGKHWVQEHSQVSSSQSQLCAWPYSMQVTDSGAS